MASPLLQTVLASMVEFSGGENTATHDLQSAAETYPARSEIRLAARPSDEVFVVRSGWVLESRALSDGRRQIARIHLPGDVIGCADLSAPRAGTDLFAATNAEVTVISKPVFATFMADNPRAAALLLLLVSRRQREDAEWLCAIGCMNVAERLQLLLLMLHERLAVIGMAQSNTFDLPLSQSDIGEHAGMTNVSVSKGLQELRNRKLIYMTGRKVTLLEIEQMRRNTEHVVADYSFETDWLGPLAILEASGPGAQRGPQAKAPDGGDETGPSVIL